MLTPDTSVGVLKGIGPTRVHQFEKLGIHTLHDLVCFFPRSYENRGDIFPLSRLDDTKPAAYILTVASEVKSAKLKNRLTLSKFRAFDESGSCEIVFFNSPYIKDVFHIGKTFRFYGKISINKNKVQLSNPKYEPYYDGIPLADFTPIYPLTEGLSGKVLEKAVKEALELICDLITDPLPDYIRIENSLPTLAWALKNIHSPDTEGNLKDAIRRLAFDEMLYFGLGISLSLGYKNAISGVRFKACDLKDFTRLLPYELTNDQKNAINDIYHDTVIKTKEPNTGHMARIIVGDVGSGKTVCAAAALFIAAKSGYQSAFMAPTEILARQHYAELSVMFDKLGIKCELLLGATTQKEKTRIYKSIESNETDIVIGTHAILSDKVNFASLGLVITDEQHRFGVAQRAVLNEKNSSAHMLVMSATPIPRTLALAMYGDLDVSKITEMPKGRQRVDTFLVDDSYRERLNAFIQKQVLSGGQCYIVCPAIEEDEDDEESNSLNAKNVKDYADNLKQSVPNLRISTLHGKMRSQGKDSVMKEFSSGEIDVLVSTTVVEVGVNVPNATLMIIEDADRYGLSQLHQLRGRVGRGSKKSYCVLVSNLKTEKARTRLDVMRSCYDGFEIANRDLELRGPGDFFAEKNGESIRQSGGFDFKLASLANDGELFEKAFTVAKSIADRDRELILPEHAELRREIEKHIAPVQSNIS